MTFKTVIFSILLISSFVTFLFTAYVTSSFTLASSRNMFFIEKMYIIKVEFPLLAPFYLCELISNQESHVNTRLGTDHHQLIMPPISKDCSNTFFELSFIYAAPCEWNKLNEHIRTSNFDVFWKSVKTMLFTQQYGC